MVETDDSAVYWWSRLRRREPYDVHMDKTKFSITRKDEEMVELVSKTDYAQQAIYRATNPSDADAAVSKERDWQYQHLLDLRNRH